jgi:hypothetical protein
VANIMGKALEVGGNWKEYEEGLEWIMKRKKTVNDQNACGLLALTGYFIFALGYPLLYWVLCPNRAFLFVLLFYSF